MTLVVLLGGLRSSPLRDLTSGKICPESVVRLGHTNGIRAIGGAGQNRVASGEQHRETESTNAAAASRIPASFPAEQRQRRAVLDDDAVG